MPSDRDNLGTSPALDGKFLQVDGRRFLVKGVSYGTFAPDSSGLQFPPLETVATDFALMARAGINTVRVYTPPSSAVLDEAARCGLRVMIGIPWAQHVAFLGDSRVGRQIRRDVVACVRAFAGHPAALLFALGNEIPPGVVRWHGRRRIERFLQALYDDAKAAAPTALLTYVNYPPTEYLDTSVFDVCSFNIYLHDRTAFSAYLARVQHIAGPRPLLVSEVGGDTLRLTEEGQASLVAMQVRTAFLEGACGAVVFAWTDEWWRGGRTVDDWAFGLVDERRQPKLALHATSRVFATAAARGDLRRWPKVSVVVCAYNAAATIAECLESLEHLDYPDYEIILVNDGSTDATAQIAARYRSVKQIDTPNGGLAAARNVGIAEAVGEIVAYTDADVRADPDWLTFLVKPFLTGDVVGAGGPNLVPHDDPWVAQCVARAPGGPTHVLLDDATAEHVPGCNMAFRREALLAIGGFDPIFNKAGDDVDLCWRLQARGWRIGFAPAALVWHRHRASIRGYWRQQVGYGEGESWLVFRHPGKFDRGRILWAGHIYSSLPMIRSMRGSQIHTGPCGTAPFPSVYRTNALPFAYLPHSGRWHVAAAALLLIGLAALSLRVREGVAPAAIGAAALALTMGKCIAYSRRSDLRNLPAVGRLGPRASRIAYGYLIALLHFLQPLARLRGRIQGWLVPPFHRRRDARPPDADRTMEPVSVLHVCLWLTARPIEARFWSEQWIDAYDFCTRLARQLRLNRFLRSIGIDDGWWENTDLSVEGGWWLRLDAQVLVEDHGAKGCVCRVAVRARPTGSMVAMAGAVALLLAVNWVPFDWRVMAGLSVAALGGMVLVSATRTWSAFRRACVQTANEIGMLDLHARPRAQPAGARPAATVPALAVTGSRRLPALAFHAVPQAGRSTPRVEHGSPIHLDVLPAPRRDSKRTPDRGRRSS